MSSVTTVVYVRISRDREGNALGVDRQEQDCRALAARLGLEVARVFVDNDRSASTLSTKPRRAFEEMMTEVEAGRIGTVLAYSNSRLTRRPKEFERLIDAYARTGVVFRTVASGSVDFSTADGRAMGRTVAAWDAAEAERVAERVRRQQEQMRAEGRWHGGWRAYGRGADGVTIDDDETRELLGAARRLLGGQSLTSLAEDLNQRGVPTSRGGRWTTRTLRRVLLRPHPATQDMAEALRSLLEDKTRTTTPGPARRWLLSGLATCGICDGPLVGSASSMGVGRGTYPAYRCRTGKHVVISALTLDEYVAAIVVARLDRADAAAALPDAPGAVEAQELADRAKALRARLDALADDLDVDERTMARRSKALREALEATQKRYAEIAGTSPLDDFGDRQESASEIWERLSLARRRALVERLMSVKVDRGSRGVVPRDRRWREDLPSFDPQRVTITWR